MNIGPTELVIILVIALIVLGPRKLPELGKSLGQAMAQFRRASDDFKRSWEQEVEMEKSRLGGIKQEVESGLGYDAGDDFNYSMDPHRGESEVAATEGSTTEHAIEPPSVEPVGEQATAPVAPAPATATVARSGDASHSEPWI